jgi:hypothetical protein
MVDRGDHKRLERLEREADTVGYLALFPGERPARAPRVMGPTLDSVVLRGMTPSGPVRRVVATRKPASVRRIEPQ